MDKLKLTVGPNFGASSAGKSFQRFARVFEKEKYSQYNRVYDHISMEGYLFVEIREMPNSGRMSNVLNWNQNYPWYLSVGIPEEINNKTRIDLNDLVIGLDVSDNLYLKSVSKNAKCKVVTDNMLNPMLNSKIANLLLSISSDYEDLKVIERLESLISNSYIYTPEISVEGITISPEKWKISNTFLKARTLKTFGDELANFDSRYKLPEYFYICQADNRLLLRKSDEASIEIMYQEFKAKKSLEICSVEYGFMEEGFVKTPKGDYYACECIFSFYNNLSEEKRMKVHDTNIVIQNHQRILTPFEDGWLYLKLYCNVEMEDSLLISFYEQKESLGIKDFFYLRYVDEIGSHVRLRIKYANQKEALKSFTMLSPWLCEMREFGLLKTFSINEYHRENNRYGGTETISVIEELFFQQSEYIIELLKKNNMQSSESLKTTYFNATALLLFQLVKNKDKMFEIIDKVVDQKNYRKEYKTERKIYIRMMEDLFWKTERNVIANKVMTLIMDNEESLTNSIDDIVLSLLHMCCNRLNGNRDIEMQTYSLLRHTLYDMIKKEKYLL